ncbi:hypothetical protein LMH87_006548 [Akanthomyces muscarius]|uniref:Uncharacterized protein n=1 Tax=Akanthomyces muscarius TaxID=2231603 RepID=A0A9W8QNI4_AKAMU|nr:hypothetical protein LMH87_006548 [Akanthomyces muscarius]KAJ4164894.1 hypothetical protein LMH87_006548 [Akanthomyces muscarius]
MTPRPAKVQSPLTLLGVSMPVLGGPAQLRFATPAHAVNLSLTVSPPRLAQTLSSPVPGRPHVPPNPHCRFTRSACGATATDDSNGQQYGAHLVAFLDFPRVV